MEHRGLTKGRTSWYEGFLFCSWVEVGASCLSLSPHPQCKHGLLLVKTEGRWGELILPHTHSLTQHTQSEAEPS